jgi:hypothetical protein
MTGYTVKPRGVVSHFKHGGFVVYEKDGHGLVAAIIDLGEMDWNSAKTACDELILNGYSDWHLPNEEELNRLYVNLRKMGIGGFENNSYWKLTDNTRVKNGIFYEGAFRESFGGRQYGNSTSNICSVRAVRTF